MDASALVPEGRPAAYRLRDGKELTFDSLMARELDRPLPTPHQFGDTKYRPGQLRADGDHAVP